LNLSALAADAGISQPTAKAWLSILETSFLVFRLPACHANINKRLVKMPKLHFYDTGLVCWLLGIRNATQLRSHPLRGAIFETWVVSEIIKHRQNQGEQRGVYYYRDRQGTEADVVVEVGSRWIVVEAKAGQTISADLAGSADKVASILRNQAEIETVCIYGGDRIQSGTRHTVLPWSQVHEHAWVASTR
jgi:predicted AAA+ superfamily ATPase